MNKLRKLFLSLILMFVSVLGLTYNVRAEEMEEITADDIVLEDYNIDVVIKNMGETNASIELYLRGLPETKENNVYYFVKFVNTNDPKPDISDFDGIDSHSVGEYNVVSDRTREIFVSPDWYLYKEYTQAYVLKCVDQPLNALACKITENSINVEKPTTLAITSRYKINLISDEEKQSFEIYPLFPSETDYKLVTKIGIINDSAIIQSIAKNESGSYERLLEYAKETQGTVYTSEALEEINTNINVVHGAYYYIYSYFDDPNNLYRDLSGISIVMGKNGNLSNDVTYELEESIWDKFIKEFKNTNLVKSIEENENYELEITHTKNSLNIFVENFGQTYETNFSYENGILEYEPSTDNDDIIYADKTWQENALYALSKLKGYDIDKVSMWAEENRNKNLTIEKDGFAYTKKEYEKNGEYVAILTTFALDIENGLKTYNENQYEEIQEEVIYKFISGENSKYKIGETIELKFEMNADSELFENLYVNDKLVDDSNYTVSKGENSTIIVLKQAYLDTLNNGVHMLKVTFKDGKFAQTEFTIEKTIINPSTGIGITSGILILGFIFVGIYLSMRKQSKFPKHN